MLEFLVAVAVSLFGLFIVYTTFSSLSAGRVARIPADKPGKKGKQHSASGGKKSNIAADPDAPFDVEEAAKGAKKTNKAAKAEKDKARAQQDAEIEELLRREAKSTSGLATDKPKVSAPATLAPHAKPSSAVAAQAASFGVQSYAAVAAQPPKPSASATVIVSERKRMLDEERGFTVVAPKTYQSASERAASDAAKSKASIDDKLGAFFKQADNKGKGGRGGRGGGYGGDRGGRGKVDDAPSTGGYVAQQSGFRSNPTATWARVPQESYADEE